MESCLVENSENLYYNKAAKIKTQSMSETCGAGW